MLWIAACGTPSSAPDQTALLASTQTIAQDFVRNGDLVSARAALEALPVANANQWLLFAVENAINDVNSNPEVVAALIQLTNASGLHSSAISQYALEHNLVLGNANSGAAQTNAAQAVAVQPSATATANSQSEPQPVATATEAPVEPTPITQVVSETGSSSETISVTSTLPLSETTPISDPVALAPSVTTTATVVVSDTPTIAAPIVSSKPSAVTTGPVNLRSGPGTTYSLLAGLQQGETLTLIGKNPTGDWWQVQTSAGVAGWVFGQLVNTSGDISQVTVALDIPPTPTLVPATAVPPTPVPQPIAQAPATQPAAAAPTAAPVAAPPAASGPVFTIAERRLWDVEENGGFLDGGSVHCGEKRELRVKVIDANGILVNGVAVQEIFGAQDIYVTGAQGKGDGTIEIILGDGQDVKVVRDADGREAQSDVATALTTQTYNIPYDVLRGARYCTDDESCRKFVEGFGCKGHFSWSVTFKRNY